MNAVTWRYVDMHCHLDRMANGPEVARDAAASGIAVLDATVAPGDIPAAQAMFANTSNVRVAAGLHPWWVTDGEDDVAARAAGLAATAPYVGEIGLDLGPKHRATADAQRRALGDVLDAVARNPLPRRVLTIHAARSAAEVLDMLDDRHLTGHGRPEGTNCILHWFSGTSDELWRALRAGCLISLNEHALGVKRCREYARVAPLDRLLLETDAPPGLDRAYSARELEASLDRAAGAIAAVRGMGVAEVRRQTAETGARLLGLL